MACLVLCLVFVKKYPFLTLFFTLLQNPAMAEKSINKGFPDISKETQNTERVGFEPTR